MRTEPTALATADGLTLVAELALPPAPAPAVVMAHPHPLYGGDMHNTVVDAVFRAAAAEDWAAIRFDFRGVGGSEGEHDDGDSERLDVAAAVDAIVPYAGDHPIVVAGYSFGALVALNVVEPRAAGWFAVAPPLRAGAPAPLAAKDYRPKHLVVADHDQFAPPSVVAEVIADWTATTTATVAMADHFFAGRTPPVAEQLVDFVRSLAGR